MREINKFEIIKDYDSSDQGAIIAVRNPSDPTISVSPRLQRVGSINKSSFLPAPKMKSPSLKGPNLSHVVPHLYEY